MSSELKDFWESRLSNDYSLSGVGYFGLGKQFNAWMYRVRRYTFLRALPGLAQVSNWQVLDIGSGTGFYVDCWKSRGVEQLTGLDITETATQQLKRKFPGYEFFQADVGDEQDLTLADRRFDAVSAMDVLFHIVDEHRFECAIQKIAQLLKPGGYFYYSDNFLHSQDAAMVHQRSRTLDRIEETLVRNGFDIVSRKPMFWLMNAPVDSQSKLLKSFWSLLERLVSKREWIGFVVGLLLYPIELLLTSLISESPSTEIMICRRK